MMNAVFEQDVPATLLAKVAWLEGFERRFKGSDVWLVKVDPGMASAAGAVENLPGRAL